MKQLLLYGMFLMQLVVGYGQEAQMILFQEAVQDYQAENYEQAIDKLKAIESQGGYSSDLYYNLGLAYMQTEDIGWARYYLAKAAQYDRHDTAIQEAIDIAADKVAVQITDIPDFLLWQWWHQTALFWTPLVWSVIQIVLFALILVVVHRILIKGRRSRAMIALLIAAISMMALSYMAGTYHQNRINNSPVAYVTNSDAAGIYLGADARSEMISQVSPGVELEIINELSEWYKVTLRDKNVGWIQKSYVTRL